MNIAVENRSSPWLFGFACVAGMLLAGCAATPPPTTPTAPELQLLTAGALELPRGCEPAAGAVYRTHYVVQADGRVTGIASGSGSGCVQHALQQWVESFQYRALAEPTLATIDWMAVTARRGT